MGRILDSSCIGVKVSFNLNRFIDAGYSFIDQSATHAHYLDGVFQLIDEAWENPDPKICRVTKDGYDSYDGPSLPNVLYASKFQPEHFNSIRNYLIDTKVKESLEVALDSNIGVCNVRAYRFTHDPPKEKTHYLDLLDNVNRCFNPHRDGIPHSAIKVMTFRAKNEEKVTLSHGPLEIKPFQEWIPIIGKCPTLAFFSNNIYHRALRPAPGKIRDAVELTIIKREPPDFLVTSGGAHAGAPKDLEEWNKIS